MFDLPESQARARQRLDGASTRRRRSDAGRSRLRPELLAELRAEVLVAERPSMTAIYRRLAVLARESGWRPPSRGARHQEEVMSAPYRPQQAMPPALARAMGEEARYWFVIGGQAVRCFAPYRPSRV